MTRSARYTMADWLAESEERRVEFIDGELIEKAAPTYEHGAAQGATVGELRDRFFGRGGRGRPGGWWFATEVEVVLDGRGFRPDIAGWRRDRLPTPPKERPVTARPDWIGEILSPTNRLHDTEMKLQRYGEAGVPHFWILDPMERRLTVHRHRPEGDEVVVVAHANESVRAEPFAYRILFGGFLSSLSTALSHWMSWPETRNGSLVPTWLSRCSTSRLHRADPSVIELRQAWLEAIDGSGAIVIEAIKEYV